MHKKITQLFTNKQTREHYKEQMLETLRTVSTENDKKTLKNLLQLSY